MPTQNPPVLDSTMKTTESTPRNLADVLASGLSSIANNVKPDGSDISISVPGMTANNVNDGFSELKSSLVDKINFDSETTTQMYNAITSSGGSLVNLTSTATATLTNNATSGVSVGYFKKSTSGHVGFSIVNYVSLSTWTGRITSSGTVEYLDRLASKSSVLDITTMFPTSSISNCNTAKSSGIYYYNASSANAPTTNGGILFSCILQPAQNQGFQLAFPNNQNFVALRVLSASTFGEWKAITTQNI